MGSKRQRNRNKVRHCMSNAASNSQYQDIEQAKTANMSIDLEQWLDAVKGGMWAVGHNDTAIVFEYRNGITNLEKYVRQIPSTELGDFITVYGSYLKEVFLKQYGSDYIRSKKIFSISLQDPQNFFPDKYSKAFNEQLQGMIDMFQRCKNVMFI